MSNIPLEWIKIYTEAILNKCNDYDKASIPYIQLVLRAAHINQMLEDFDKTLEAKKEPKNYPHFWLSVLTNEQRELRKQGKYDELNLTEEQKEVIGEQGCYWIESPSLYSQSKYVD